ncbi:MAG: hypothetical protein NUW01_05140, partial [Gemmatimonadaceae bacterium]|nr:hypothetical protein [Gemmatimonadaceae bacterium]
SKPSSDLGSVHLDPDELHRFAQLLGAENDKRLTALINSKDYSGLPDEEKAKLWSSEMNKARGAAKGQFASVLLGVDPSNAGAARISTTPTKEGKALGLFLQATTDKFKRAEVIDNWTSQIDDPAFREALASALPKDGPTLDQYQEAWPLIQQVEKMPRFANATGQQIGDEKIWSRYDDERGQFNDIGKRTDLTAEQKTLMRAAFRKAHPVFDKYENLSPANPIRTKFIKDHPVLSVFY